MLKYFTERYNTPPKITKDTVVHFNLAVKVPNTCHIHQNRSLHV
jgi:hypothetical protein